MKAPISKPAKANPIPVFPIVIRKRGAQAKTAASDAKPEKRDNIFSKSRDTREDRSTRQMKTSPKHSV